MLEALVTVPELNLEPVTTDDPSDCVDSDDAVDILVVSVVEKLDGASVDSDDCVLVVVYCVIGLEAVESLSVGISSDIVMEVADIPVTCVVIVFFETVFNAAVS